MDYGRYWNMDNKAHFLHKTTDDASLSLALLSVWENVSSANPGRNLCPPMARSIIEQKSSEETLSIVESAKLSDKTPLGRIDQHSGCIAKGTNLLVACGTLHIAMSMKPLTPIDLGEHGTLPVYGFGNIIGVNRSGTDYGIGLQCTTGRADVERQERKRVVPNDRNDANRHSGRQRLEFTIMSRLVYGVEFPNGNGNFYLR